MVPVTELPGGLPPPPPGPNRLGQVAQPGSGKIAVESPSSPWSKSSLLGMPPPRHPSSTHLHWDTAQGGRGCSKETKTKHPWRQTLPGSPNPDEAPLFLSENTRHFPCKAPGTMCDWRMCVYLFNIRLPHKIRSHEGQTMTAFFPTVSSTQ